MTNDNYTLMTNQELIDCIKRLNKIPDILDRYLRNHYPNLYSEVVLRTNFLDPCDFKRNSVSI